MATQAFPFFPIQLHPEMGRQALYMCAPYPIFATDGLLIREEQELTVDGMMNSLYDREMLPFVGGKRLALRIQVQGACRVMLIHRAANGHEIEYGSTISAANVRLKDDGDVEGEVQTFELDFRLMSSEQTFGRWFFRLASLKSDIKLLSATWLVRGAELSDISPAFVICTFKRESQVIANVRGLIEVLEPPQPPATPRRSLFSLRRLRGTRNALPVPSPAQVKVADYCIFLVDNAGTLPPATFPSSTVRLIRQRNVGGAGGFGRGIFEALEAGSAFTHIIMLDDDADVDALSIVRMLNLMRLSRDPKLFIGGLQFDTYSPNQLADAGTFWTPERFEKPIGRMAPSDAGTIESRDAMARSHISNFNGWWLFGGRTEAFRTFGMPLPCFVHLDDVEFGVRVQLMGGYTVTVPGIAVWHEPYYAKVEGWFAYYNIRNELIRLSAQMPIVLAQTSDRPKSVIARRSQARLASVSRRLRNRFRDFVNSYQYGSAILLARAIEDFAIGATLFRDDDPEALHLSVMAEYREANTNYRYSLTLPTGFVPEHPSRGRKLYRLAQIYSRNGNRVNVPGRKEMNRITMFGSRRDISWKWTPARQAWAYPDPGSAAYHIYKFDRDIYAKVDARFRRAIRQFENNSRSAQVSWSEAYSELTSHVFWSKIVKTF